MNQINYLIIIVLTYCVQSVFSGQLCGNSCEELENPILFPFLFTENNAQKTFIYPNKTRQFVTRSQAIELCAQYNNATLVDIESEEKQLLAETYMDQFYSRKNYARNYYWIGGQTEDLSTYKWRNSGHNFSYTNWAPTQPESFDGNRESPYTYIAYWFGQQITGQWFTTWTGDTNDVFCELTLNN